ncbi:hypothetical protein SEA_HUWBERT_14 [Microbacterium phage Huwbert]|nr:hypothetical protein SEA_HUWBERT_14 [Microbacterium phage Huwbert]
MTNSRKTLLSVAWRGLPKRAWFKREKYTARITGWEGTRTVETSPKFWHAGVDIIQVRTPNPDPSRNLEHVKMHVRALCGYEYIFDWWTAANQYGKAIYKDEIKTIALRCPRCMAELEKAPQDRRVNGWATPATTSDMLSADQEHGPWYPSEET